MIIPQEVTAEVNGGSVVFDAGMSSTKAPAPHVFRRVDVEGPVASPHSNTGAQSAKALVDWLALTFHGRTLEDVLTIFGPGLEWQAADRGAMGYRSCLFRGDVRVYHQGMIGMGVHVVISGQGCRQLEEEGVIDFEPGALFGWRGMLESLLGLGANVARLDVAMDDREGLLRLDVIRQSVRAGACVSRFKAGTMYEKCSLVDGCGQGETAYFGSKKSNMFIRIYDKAKEQLLPAGVHWVRVEAQARNENAQQLAQLIVDKGLGVLAPVLNGYVRFVEPSETDSTRSRWAVCDWWSAFLGVVERMPLGVAPVCRTLGEVADNLRRQYAPAIAMVMNSPIMGTRWLRETVSDGMARWRPKHFDMMAAAVEHLKPCFADSAAAPKHRAVPPYLLGLSLGETLRDRRIKAAWSGE